MKAALLCLILIFATAAYGEDDDTWIVYSESTDGCTYYLDTESIKPMASGWTQVNDGCLCEDGRVMLAVKRIDTVNHRFMLEGAFDVTNKVQYGPSATTYDIIPGTVLDALENLLRTYVEKERPTV